MPELPEVETTKRGIAPLICGQKIVKVVVRQPKLRWPVPDNLPTLLSQQTVTKVTRRGKYLLLSCGHGTLLIHLGMSGSLRVIPATTPILKHDHVDFCFSQQKILRFHDPRRFGAILWTDEPPLRHRLLAKLGPEPLSAAFNAKGLQTRLAHCQRAIKVVLMDSQVVVGVGNIYASETLFLAGIHPQAVASKISLQRLQRLVQACKQVLQTAIKAGGTTLRDFVDPKGRPGYFQQSLAVYGRAGEPCLHCGAAIRVITLAQRSTYYCGRCQR